MATHAAEIVLGVIFGICLFVGGGSRIVVGCVKFFGALWFLYVLALFIATQVFFFESSNDCKNGTAKG